MKHAVIAKRYAEALFELGEDKELLETFSEQFDLINEVLTDHEQLFTFLKHPRVTQKEKEQFVQKVFANFNEYVKNTILLLVERQRIDVIPSIVDQFRQLVNDAKGIAVATVQSVRPLKETEQDALAKQLAKDFNKQTVKLDNVVNPDILGGLRIRIGNTIYDGTVRGKLNRLERNIATANK